MTAIILDTETTGLVEPEVVELAWLRYGTTDGNCERFKPTKPIEWGALSTHHILMEDLEGRRSSREARLPERTQYLIGHNVDFDWMVLGKPNVKRICTLALSRHLFPTLDSHKLTTMMYYFEGATAATRERVLKAHSALDDVLMTRTVLQHLERLIEPPSLEDLWRASEDARIPRIMTFGKHRGKPVAEVDRGYAAWYRKQPEPDPYLLQAFKREGLLP